MVFRPAGAGGFAVERPGPGAFAVRGRGIELLLARYDIENEDAMAYLEGRLRRIGVIRALEEAVSSPATRSRSAASPSSSTRPSRRPSRPRPPATRLPAPRGRAGAGAGPNKLPA